MGLKGRIKQLEQRSSELNPQPGVHVILFRLGVDNVDALIDDYRNKGGKLPIYALPKFDDIVQGPKINSQAGKFVTQVHSGDN